MKDLTHDTIYSIVMGYGCLTLSFLEEQAVWQGVSKEETERCIRDFIKDGIVSLQPPGMIRLVKELT
jgi:hypothetical protein